MIYLEFVWLKINIDNDHPLPSESLLMNIPNAYIGFIEMKLFSRLLDFSGQYNRYVIRFDAYANICTNCFV